MQDVIVRRYADQALRDSEERYRTLVEALREMICTVGLDGRFTSFNPALQVLTGWPEEHWIGRVFAEMVHPADLQACLAAFEGALRGEMGPIVRHRILKRSGEWLEVESTGAPLFRDGRVIGVLGLVRDVADRVRAKEDLERSRHRLEAAEEVAHLGSWEWDLGTNELTWSEERYRLLGLERATCSPSWEAFIERVHPGDRARVADLHHRTAREGGQFAYEARIVRPDGETRFIHARVHAVRDADGSIRRLIGISQDITERKESEEARRRLFQRVTSAHEEERARLSRELHDGPGQSLAALLVGLRRIEDAPTLAGARGAARQQRELVAQTIDELSRLARGLRPTALDDLGLPAALERHATEQARVFGFDVLFRGRGLGRRRLPREVETALYRIAQEALSNVARHACAGRVVIETARSATAVRLVVSDDGCGFEGTAVPPSAGHLGLHDIRERATLVGGVADIRSQPGSGTTVSVEVPLR